jgi:hypothetical protein
VALGKRFGALAQSAYFRAPLNATVHIRQVSYEYGFGFDSRYHPYTQALALTTVSDGADLLSRFYDAMEQWRGKLNDWQALPVQAWRFGKSKRASRLVERIPSVHFGWVPQQGPDQARRRVEYLFRLRDSISQAGYFADSSQPIDGVWVGKTFLVLGGQHRVAVLASLGWEKIPVTNVGRKNTPKKLVAKKIPLVVSGQLTVDDATKILSRIEEGFSLAEAEQAGFPFASSNSLRSSDA